MAESSRRDCEMAEFEGFEIDDELLESITGGVLTAETRDKLIVAARNMMTWGCPIDSAIKLLAERTTDEEERVAIIKEIYGVE